MMSDRGSWILESTHSGFGTYDGSDEKRHVADNALITSAAATETQYFGFNSPEYDIHGFTILWAHPAIGAASGGIIAWQGHKTSQLACEIYDYRGFMGEDIFVNDLHHVVMDSGVEHIIDEPLQRMRTRYRDDARGNALDLTYRAASPPAMRVGNHHFEQGLKIEGEITLRGKTYPIDSYTVRDRSWGEARSEEPMPLPPLAWISGIFGDDFSFGCMSFEDSSRPVDWAEDFEMPPESALKGGWIWYEGRMRSIVRASRLTRRDPVTRQPMAHDMTLWDDSGEVFELEGDIHATAPFTYWFNIDAMLGLIRWKCRGRTGCGDSQEAQWTDYVRSFIARNPT
ncbi:MAG: hypothetical protein P8Y58_10345 [Novosphingobium sp.]